MSKNWWESKTIQSAVWSWAIAIGTLGWNAYERGEITRVDVGAVLGASITLRETIEGRKRAAQPIAGSENKYPVLPPEAPIELPPSTNVVYNPDSTPVPDEPVIDNIENLDKEGELDINLLDILQKSYSIEIIRTTKIKTSDNDSSLLSLQDYKTVEEGDEFDIFSWSFVEMTNHIKVKLEEDGDPFFLYVPHVKLYNSQGKEVSIEDADPTFVKTNKTPFKLPGYTSTFYLEDSVIAGGHFYWSEVTKGGTRIPENKAVVENVIAIAHLLEEVREQLGNRPITVTSWYRPPAVNRAVGGAPRSKHLTGGAVDIVVHGLSASRVQDILRPTWKGGIGLANTFTHLDLGPERAWRYG